MAQQTASSAASLRALTYRITSTPIKQLPKIASQIAGTIGTCRDLLSAPSDAKRSSDAQTAVHRFKTQLSTLLQDRTIEGRWAAVVLVKAAIEAGGAEVLSKCNPWVRSLLGILKKPDPPTTRILVTLTLTRIFTLTWDNSTLVREITTPALTAFIPTCLANLESKRCSSTEQQAIFDAFATLLPRHPTIFRTNEVKLRAILALMISSASTESDGNVHYTEAHRTMAMKLWVLLNDCAPKSGASEKWNDNFNASIKAAHATCDQIFRAVQEEWQSTTGVQPTLSNHLSGEVEIAGDDAAGLKSWKGIFAGGERLVALLGLLESHISTATPGNVAVRIGQTADLLSRLLGIAIPTTSQADSVKFNNQVSRDEREALFTVLPSIHVAALVVTTALLERLEWSAIPWVQSLVDQSTWVFRAEASHFALRRASYKFFSIAIDLTGPSMSKNDVADLEPVLNACCQDVLLANGSSGPAQSKHFEASKNIKRSQGDSSLLSSAQRLLCVSLSRLDSLCITPKLRAQMDRTGILTKDKSILFSSVMNAQKKQNGQRTQASLLPILAREFPSSLETEALLRPRVPPLSVAPRKQDIEETEEVEDDKSEQDAVDEIEERESDPAADLLNALAQNSSMNAFDISSQSDPDQTSSKRKADEGVELSAKRLRASPIAESLLPESASTLPGPESSFRHINIPETVIVEAAQSTATLPGPSGQEPTDRDFEDAGLGVEASQDVASDDSDFEMPRLTMEPDTDSEDEE